METRVWIILVKEGLISNAEQIRNPGTRPTEPEKGLSEKTGITSHGGVNPTPKGEKDSGNHQAGIQVAASRKLENIVFQGSRFIVRLAYDTEEIQFIKSLKAAYWHPDERHWICKGSKVNLEKLQKHYDFWSPEKYREIHDLIANTNRKMRAILERAPGHDNRIHLSLRGDHMHPDWIKQLPGRGFDKPLKVWSFIAGQFSRREVIVRLEQEGWEVYDYLPNGFDDVE